MKTLYRAIMIILLLSIIHGVSAYSGTVIDTISTPSSDEVPISINIDSENNVYVLTQSGTSATGSIQVRVFSPVVQKITWLDQLRSVDFIGVLELNEVRIFSFAIHVLVIWLAVITGWFITRPRKPLKINQRQPGEK